MLNVTCVLAVLSVPVLLLATGLMLFHSVRTGARRSAIAAAIVGLTSAAVFSHTFGSQAEGARVQDHAPSVG